MPQKKNQTPQFHRTPHIVLRVVTKTLLPFIIMFGLYVQFHGEYSPGGGFQAGVIVASALLLYVMAFGLEKGKRLVSVPVVQFLTALGVLIYAGTGILCMLLGGNFLDYSVLSSDPVEGQKLGILIIEMGVGLTVCSVMLLLFMAFVLRYESQH